MIHFPPLPIKINTIYKTVAFFSSQLIGHFAVLQLVRPFSLTVPVLEIIYLFKNTEGPQDI